MAKGFSGGRLTVLKIASLKPRKHEYIESDGDGLGLLVRPSGEQSWILRFRVNGVPKKLTLGRGNVLSLAEARRIATIRRGELAAGRDPGDERKAARQEAEEARLRRDAARRARQDAEQRTVEAIFEKWLAKHVRLRCRPGPAKEYERIFRKDILPKIGSRPLAEITRIDVKRLVAAISDSGRPVLANRAFSAIRAMVNWARMEDFLDGPSPCDGLKRPGHEVTRDRVLNDPELVAVWKAAEDVGWPYGPLTRLLLLTGCRRNEWAAARWEEVDFERAELQLSKARTKNNREFVLPLSSTAVKLLQSLPGANERKGFIFGAHKETPAAGFSKWKLQIDDAVLEYLPAPPARWTLHDLRRTFATGLAKLRVQPHVIEATINHVSGQVSGVAGTYNRHAYYEEKRAALQQWDDHVERLVGFPLADAA